MSLQKPLAAIPNLRVLIDAVPQHLLFVYEHLADDLLRLGQRDLPALVRRRILRDALTGLAELHDRGIVHTGQLLQSPDRSNRQTLIGAGRLTIQQISSQITSSS